MVTLISPHIPAIGVYPQLTGRGQAFIFPVAHRQVVLTIPKRLRVHTRFDRKLLGKLSSCAWTCLKAEAVRLLGREDVVLGMIAAIQTHGQLLHWHPHIHVLITCAGQIVYQAEKQACHAFPDPKGDGTQALSKVLQSLRDAGIVQMRRGSGGGVSLVGDAKKITILEVINAVDPLERITKCPLGLPGHEKLCPLHASLDEAMARVEEVLSSKTIADILPTGQISLAACQFPEDSAS